MSNFPPSQRTLKQIHEDVPVDHYDKGIKKNFFQKIWHHSRFTQIDKEIIPLSDKVLDIGCHSGLFTKRIKERSKAKKIYGIDISRNAIIHARQRIKDGNFQVADAHKLPFKDNTFGAVFCLEVLEHIENPSQVLSEIHRVLKPKGYSLVLIPTNNLPFRIIWYIWNRIYDVWNHAHVQDFRDNSLEKLVKKANLHISSVKKFNLGMLKIIKFYKL